MLPKTKPYKPRDCDPPAKKRVARKRPIDPIAYQPTIDPCVCPRAARLQRRERKRAEAISSKRFARGARARGRERAVVSTASRRKEKPEDVREKDDVQDQDQDKPVEEKEEVLETEEQQDETD